MKSLNKVNIVKLNCANNTVKIEDQLAVEEPLQISVDFGKSINRQNTNIAITMRTPGADALLSIGFLFTEGIIKTYEEVELITVDPLDENKISLQLSPTCNFDVAKLSRHLFTSSSCGVCGKTSIDNLQSTITYQALSKQPKVATETLYSLPQKLRDAQNLFDKSGGIHAAGLFNPKGDLLNVQEDVGRHNALDKLLGWALQNKLVPLQNHLILVSGRSSFELVQKALMAGCFFLAAVGAPSSLAVELASSYNMTLIGFLKNKKANVYCGAERLETVSG